MEASVNYLLSVLQREISHLDLILDFLFEKENALIKNEMSMIQRVVLKEHEYFVKSRDLELTRISVVEVIAKKLGLKSANLSLKQLSEKLGAGTSERLRECRRQLRERIDRINVQNRKCELLLKKSIEMVNYSMNLISGSVAKSSKGVYNQNCQKEDKANLYTFVDQRG